MSTLHGQCRCGNIRFTLACEPMPEQLPARACDCSFCTARGAAWTSIPGAALRIHVADPTRQALHRFATGTADFHICATCDDLPVVTSNIDGQLHAVVNVGTLRDLPERRLLRQPISLGDEPANVRLARRKRGWIGDVQITVGMP